MQAFFEITIPNSGPSTIGIFRKHYGTVFYPVQTFSHSYFIIQTKAVNLISFIGELASKYVYAVVSYSFGRLTCVTMLQGCGGSNPQFCKIFELICCC